MTKSPKLHFLDAGLLAAMRDVSPDVVGKGKTSFGLILETFVFSELRKIASWSEQRCSFSHFPGQGQERGRYRIGEPAWRDRRRRSQVFSYGFRR